MNACTLDFKGQDLRGLAIVILLAWLLAACAQVDPVPIATATPTQMPTATATLKPSPTPPPTSTPPPELRQLTGGGCCVQPSWSPDSRQVLFIDKPSESAPAGIYAVDVITGAIELPQWSGRVGVYSRDRSLIAYPENSTTVVERLSTGDKWTLSNVGQVVFSPDSQRLAWTDEPDNTSPYDQRRSDVYVANVNGTDAARIARVYGGGLVGWLPGGKIVLSGRPSLDVRERTLTVLDLTTRASVSLVTAERISGVSASKDGTWIAYYITFDQSRSGIWMQRANGSPARKIEMWGAYQWRDDARLLVIPMRPPGDAAFEVWEIDAASGASRKLTDAATTPLRILNGDWRVSPDGRYIVYVSSVDRNLWRLTLPGGSG